MDVHKKDGREGGCELLNTCRKTVLYFIHGSHLLIDILFPYLKPLLNYEIANCSHSKFCP